MNEQRYEKDIKLANAIMSTINDGSDGLTPRELTCAICIGLAGVVSAVGHQEGMPSAKSMIKNIGTVLIKAGPRLIEELDKEMEENDDNQR